MKILVIDGQGGNMGFRIAKMILEQVEGAVLRVVGTNSIATANMLKSGAAQGATGENAVIVGCRWADVIVGPIGIVIADSLMGEVTASMAASVGQSDAVRVLIPLNKCDTVVAGTEDKSAAELLEAAVEKVKKIASK